MAAKLTVLSKLSVFHGKKHTHTFNGPFPGLHTWAGTRKIKPIWILLKQETVSGSGISWATYKSAPRSRQTTTPAPHHSVFYRPDALPVAQPIASKHWRLIHGKNNNYKISFLKRQLKLKIKVKILITVTHFTPKVWRNLRMSPFHKVLSCKHVKWLLYSTQRWNAWHSMKRLYLILLLRILLTITYDVAFELYWFKINLLAANTSNTNKYNK